MIHSLSYLRTAITVVLLFFASLGHAQEINIVFQDDPKQTEFGQVYVVLTAELAKALRQPEVSEADIKNLFKVYVGKEIPADPTFPAVAGTYRWQASQLIFIPRFDPPPGMVYTAVFNLELAYALAAFALPQGSESKVQVTFQFPELIDQPPVQLTAVYPSGDEVPANLLRIYLHFSGPMGLGNPHDHIRLLNHEGEVIESPFVEIPEGLWDANRTRLTLFLHPGRVKRGVGLNLTMGEILTPGQWVQLQIDPRWKDAMGHPAQVTNNQKWMISAPIREKIDTDQWDLEIPESGTQLPLIIRLDRSLDQALATRLIRVLRQDQELEMRTELNDDEQTLSFSPVVNWKTGDYTIVVSPKLEDQAGNTIHHLFDTQTARSASTSESTGGPIYIPFTID